LLEAHDTTFDRFGRCRPTRVLGLHATPLPLGGKVPPGRHHPAPGSYSRVRHYCQTFRLSVERFSSPRFRFDSHLPELSPHGAQRHVGHVIGKAHHRSRILGLHTTPVDCSATVLPGRHPPEVSSRRTRLHTRLSDSRNVSRADRVLRPGDLTPSIGPFEPPDGAALSRAPAFCRTSFPFITRGKLPGLLGLQATPVSALDRAPFVSLNGASWLVVSTFR
jgi:hypothetical protein